MSTANNTRLAKSDAPPASAPANTNNALDRLAQHYRDQARIAALEAERGVHRTNRFADGGKIMMNPEREIHPTAQILWDALQAGRFTRVDVVRQLRLNSRQVVSGWLANGVPDRHIYGLARMCGVSPEEYRARSGLSDTDPDIAFFRVTPQVEKLINNFETLPPALQNYFLRKIKEAKKFADTLPAFLLQGVPEEYDKLRAWEHGFFEAMDKAAVDLSQAQAESSDDPEIKA